MPDRRCPYAAQLWTEGFKDRVLLRCERRRHWWVHRHRARLALPIAEAGNHVVVTWWSSAGPDYHVEYERASATVIEHTDA